MEALDRHKSCAQLHLSLHDHDNIVKVFGFHFSGPENIFHLFMELAEGSLRDIIGTRPKNPALKEELFRCMAPRDAVAQIFHGVAYIHSKTDKDNNKISHRDLKPENVLIVRRQRDGSLVNKITDFDSGKQMDEELHASMTTGLPIFTPLYLDPNLKRKKKQKEKATVVDYLMHDVFGAAEVAYEVMGSGDHLYQGRTDDHIIVNILDNKRDMLAEASIDELAKNLIWTLTQTELEDRITMEEAKAAPYFQDTSVHIQLLYAVNEAILGLSKSTEGNRVIDELNNTFFAVFQAKWQDQDWPFIIAEVLKGSRYTNSLDSFLRYCRNLIAHAGQHKTILEAKFGKVPTAEELLKMILEYTSRMVIHLYWFAKRYLKQLGTFTKSFPDQCAKAYEDLLAYLHSQIGAGMEALRLEVDPPLSEKAKAPATPSKGTNASMDDHVAIIDAYFGTSHKDIQAIIERTEVDFAELKRDVQQWELEEKKLKAAIEGMKKSKSPDEGKINKKINKKMAELETVKERLRMKWILEYRELIRNKDRFLALEDKTPILGSGATNSPSKKIVDQKLFSSLTDIVVVMVVVVLVFVLAMNVF